MATTFSGALALDHTAVAVHDFESVLPFYRDLLGGEVVFGRDVPANNYKFLQLRYPNGAQVELIAPLGESGFMHDFLAKHGEGPHHLTFLVADLRVAVAAAREAGIGWASVRGTVHTGAIGYYTSRIAAAGMAAVGVVAGIPQMAYEGARGVAVATSPR